VTWLASRQYRRSDGVDLRLERIAMDSGWGETSRVVYRVSKECKTTAELLPSKGRGITAAQRPMTEYKREPGQKLGDNWRLFRPRMGRLSIRLLEYDTNHWKSFVRTRLFTGMGDRGGLCIFGNDAEETRLLAEHLSSETATPTEGNGRKVDIWKLIPNRENHWLDCVVGCHVLASMAGCSLDATGGFDGGAAAAPRKKQISLPNY
jgi:phage terminase large subunit GpA-like protein